MAPAAGDAEGATRKEPKAYHTATLREAKDDKWRQPPSGDDDRGNTSAGVAHSEWQSLCDWRIMQAIRALFLELNDRGSRIRQPVPRDSQFVEDVSEHQLIIHTGDLVASERFPLWISVDYADAKEGEEASRKTTVQEASALIGLSTRALWSRIRRATERARSLRL